MLWKIKKSVGENRVDCSRVIMLDRRRRVIILHNATFAGPMPYGSVSGFGAAVVLPYDRKQTHNYGEREKGFLYFASVMEN